MSMIYAVIDTNVLVSAYLTHNLSSATTKVVDALFRGRICPLYNEEIMAEYEEVLSRPHFRIGSEQLETLMAYIRKHGVATERTPFEDLLVDEDDRVFYEVALTEEDSFLVTGNLKHYPVDPRVVTPAQMVAILEG